MRNYAKALTLESEYRHLIKVISDSDGTRIEVRDVGENEFKFALAFSPKEIPALIEMLKEICE